MSRQKSINTTFQLVLFTLLLVCTTKSYTQPISFNKVGVNEGLSQVSVLSIYKDDLNRMWFGTRNGLNCWDGEKMKSYYPNDQDSLESTSFSMIKIIHIGNELWLHSRRQELLRFNLNTLRFEPKRYQNIFDIDKQNNSLVACSKEEIFRFQQETDSFKIIFTSDIERCFFSSIYSDNNGTLWLFDKRNNLIVKYEEDSYKTIQVPQNIYVNDLMVDNKEQLWIATQFHGIYIYDEESNHFEIIDKESSPYHLASNNVRSIKQDKKGRMWIGTFYGVSMLDFFRKTSTHYTANNSANLSLSNNSVHSLYISEDNLWVGTYYGGVNCASIFNPLYTFHHLSPNMGTNSNAIISDMVEDKAGNLWIGTEGDGLYFYHTENKAFTHYPQMKDHSGPSQTNIKSLCLTDDQLLIGTYRGGLNCFDLKTKTFKYYDNDIKNIIAIKPYKDHFFLGTHRGLYRFNPQDESFTLELSPEELSTRTSAVIIRDLLLDSREMLWLGTAQNGLIKYNLKNKKLEHYLASPHNPYSISNNAINYLFEDESSHIWAGSLGGGLNRYNCKENNFTVYNRKNSQLQDNFICSIIETRLGNIWVATSKGISILNKKNKTFYNFGNQSGFPITELNTRALLQTSSGNIFVGGIGGLISFKESNLLLTKDHFNVIISDLEVNNRKVNPNDATHILNKDITITQKIVLQPEHSSFKINFSACNYKPQHKCNYQYKLEGFDKEWIDAKFNTYASYTNLNSGKYKFMVRAVDMSKQVISDIKTIQIVVKPPVWKRWYAYLLYILILAILLLIFNYIYLDKIRLALELKNERKENERIKELNLYKLRFFTNISHEFMTPLTIMLSSLENVLSNSKLNTQTIKQLQKVNFNAKRLKNLNRELLDFRRIEQGFLNLNVSKNELVSYITQCFEAFEEMAKIKNIQYSIESNTEHAPLWFDPIQMDKVFYNLLSNAFNHADEKAGSIQVEIHNKTDELLIEVTNNGKGIPKDEVDKIFNRFFQSTPNKEHNEYYGSGIGLALSQSIIKAHHGTIWCESIPNHFTTFSVLLKKGKDHFDPSTIRDISNYSTFTFEKDLIEDPISSAKEEHIEETLPADAPTLLIVDDNKEILGILKGIFKRRFHILLAEDGYNGLQIAIDKQPDLIISDIKMPKLSGLEMCKKLKRNISTSHIPIALISAMSSEEDKTLAFNCGANSFIAKPFKTETLLARIESLLINKNLMQSKFASNLKNHDVDHSLNKEDKEFMKHALSIIEINKSNSEFSITDFAKAMHMSRTLFFEKIKAITGLTPNDFIQTTRLKKAAELLNNDPNTNVSQVAYSLGFNSPQYFSRCFKQHFGVSPSKYGEK